MYLLRKLSISAKSALAVFITPCLGSLTHLELHNYFSTSDRAAIEIVLRDGASLQSLRINHARSVAASSIYFRKYSQSLPHLKQFGVSFLSPASPAEYDYDLFPAILDFLQDKQYLVTLELVASDCPRAQMGLGFSELCWSFLPRFRRLRGLSITLAASCDIQHCAQLVPRSVNTLTLSGAGLIYPFKITGVSSHTSSLVATSLFSVHFVELTAVLAEKIIFSSC